MSLATTTNREVAKIAQLMILLWVTMLALSCISNVGILRQHSSYGSTQINLECGKRSCAILQIAQEEQEQRVQQHAHRHYFLAAVIFNRVFVEDKFNITTYECKQWIEHMLFAGIDHVYWYDTAHEDMESQEHSLAKYVVAGLLTYHRFYSLFPVIPGSDFHYEQDSSYRHFLENYRSSAEWVVEMDVDEYPFSPVDRREGFMRRYLQTRISGNVSQVLLQCMIFAGNPRGDSKGMVMERYTRRNPRTNGREPMGYATRQKPVFKPVDSVKVSSNNPHMFPMRRGKTVVAPAKELRMNHYWGPRETAFGSDTPEVLKKLVEDPSMLPIAEEIRKRMKQRENSR